MLNIYYTKILTSHTGSTNCQKDVVDIVKLFVDVKNLVKKRYMG